MADLNDMLEGLENTSYIPQEKKGAPQIDAPELDDILAPPPAAWTPTSEKKGAPVVDEPVLLEDTPTAWQGEKKGAPQIEAPELDAPAAYAQTAAPAKEALPAAEDLQADLLGAEPAAYDPVTEFYEKLKFTDDLKKAFSTLDAEKQIQVVEMRAKQMGIPVPQVPRELRPALTAAPAGEEASAEAPVEAPALEEAPKPQAYVPKFKDEDLERAKEDSKKARSYSPPPQQEMTEEQKKQSRQFMNELREEREKEAAKKGFRLLILMAILGVIGGASLAIFFSGAFGLGYKDVIEEQGFMNIVKQYAPYLGLAVGVGSLALIAPIGAIRGIVRFLDGLSFVLMLFPGIPLLIQKDGNGLLNGVFFAAALLLMGFSTVMLTTNDKINMYYKHGNS